jgi:hypothetical protein
MYARIVTLTFDDLSSFPAGRSWIEERLQSNSAEPGLVHQYWLVDSYEAKVVSVAVYEDVAALERSEERLARVLAEVVERFPPRSESVEVFAVIAAR